MTADSLRARLSAMRTELVNTLVQNGVEQPSHLPVVAGIDAALDALSEMPEVEEMPTPDALRERLWQVREDALFGLARYRIEPSRLALAADAHAAIEASGEGRAEWEPASRVAVGDSGAAIRLTLCREKDKAAWVELSPADAVALAGRLLAAASLRLR